VLWRISSDVGGFEAEIRDVGVVVEVVVGLWELCYLC